MQCHTCRRDHCVPPSERAAVVSASVRYKHAGCAFLRTPESRGELAPPKLACMRCDQCITAVPQVYCTCHYTCWHVISCEGPHNSPDSRSVIIQGSNICLWRIEERRVSGHVGDPHGLRYSGQAQPDAHLAARACSPSVHPAGAGACEQTVAVTCCMISLTCL